MSQSKTTFTIRYFAAGPRSEDHVPALVAVHGPLDVTSAVVLQMVVGDLVDNDEVVVDLRDCAPLEAAGLAALDRLAERLCARGGILTTLGAPPCVPIAAAGRAVAAPGTGPSTTLMIADTHPTTRGVDRLPVGS